MGKPGVTYMTANSGAWMAGWVLFGDQNENPLDPTKLKIHKLDDNLRYVQFTLKVTTATYENKKPDYDYFKCKAWGYKADFIEKNIRKNDFVFITGHLKHTKVQLSRYKCEDCGHEGQSRKRDWYHLNIVDLKKVPSGIKPKEKEPEKPMAWE